VGVTAPPTPLQASDAAVASATANDDTIGDAAAAATPQSPAAAAAAAAANSDNGTPLLNARQFWEEPLKLVQEKVTKLDEEIAGAADRVKFADAQPFEETPDGATIRKDLFDGAVPERDQLCSVRESTLNLSVGVPVEKRGRPWGQGVSYLVLLLKLQPFNHSLPGAPLISKIGMLHGKKLIKKSARIWYNPCKNCP